MAIDPGPPGLVDVVPKVDFGRLKEVKARDYIARFALGATISIVAAVLVKLVGPRFGGMFLAFPAILPASLTLVEEKEGRRSADRNAIGAVLGGFGLSVFAGTAEKAFFHLPSVPALLLALLAWAASAVALYALLAFLRPEDCDRRRD